MSGRVRRRRLARGPARREVVLRSRYRNRGRGATLTVIGRGACWRRVAGTLGAASGRTGLPAPYADHDSAVALSGWRDRRVGQPYGTRVAIDVPWRLKFAGSRLDRRRVFNGVGSSTRRPSPRSRAYVLAGVARAGRGAPASRWGFAGEPQDPLRGRDGPGTWGLEPSASSRSVNIRP